MSPKNHIFERQALLQALSSPVAATGIISINQEDGFAQIRTSRQENSSFRCAIRRTVFVRLKPHLPRMFEIIPLPKKNVLLRNKPF
ncbi:MAG: hypothetical protein COZ70_06710 [Deltaproteobacteria bacterium CG_4_8_14_3_um_filter_51_11]|nr:MAG: hypothetical protein COX16_02535 [Deltaproteobacteria bacterium CG23_combo_of_CG06-09_8_20_14_all_51_20]PIX19850.1 MAG: hypothetical protein COZ70_06710 [Deltaproteobacteria bacterium CG_4_8_14_3_um_filter_51_11]